MFRTSRVKLDKALVARCRRHAEITGYSSVEEFITHALEKELRHFESKGSEEEIKRRLKGLGYLG